MKTTIEYKGGPAQVVHDVMPSFDAEGMSMYLMDAENTVTSDDIDLHTVARVIFEND